MDELEPAVEIAWIELDAAMKLRDRKRYRVLLGLWRDARARLDTARYEASEG